MKRLTDTSPEAERVLIDAYRKMPIAQKWLILGEIYRDARALHAAGVRFRSPEATAYEIRQAWVTTCLDCPAVETIKEVAMEQDPVNLRGLREVIQVFSDLGIAYALGGSMASSLFGISRHTRDADITVEPFPGKETPLADAFGSDYYVSLPAIREALRDRSSFNIIKPATGFKVDVFLRKDYPFERMAMKRRIALKLPDSPEQPIIVHSPEDVILFKLRWYRLGNESSEQQWKDILGVLQVQAGKLDDAYLDHWAKELKISDLLERARQEAVI